MSWKVLSRDLVWIEDTESDYVHFQREATEDDEQFDEDDKPLVQLGDMIWDVIEPAKRLHWCVVIEAVIGEWAGTVYGYGQTDVDAELDAIAKAAAHALRSSKVD